MASVETSQDSDEEYGYVNTVNYAESKKPPMCRVQIDGNVVQMMIDSGAPVNLLDETTFQRINNSDNKTLRPAHNKIYSYGSADYAESKKPPMCRVQIDGNVVQMMIDSGAPVNLLDETTFQRINNSGNKTLRPAHNKIYSYGSATPLPLLGTFTASIKSSSIKAVTQLHVVKGNTGNLLSYNTAQKLGLIRISINTTTVTDGNKKSPEFLQEELKSLFGGVGKVPNKVVKLHIDSDVIPRKQPHRRIPFHVREDVEKELERLERLDITEKVDGPTPWISPIVVVPKISGEVRICDDMRKANKAIKREKHLVPTIDDLITDLNGATHFSSLNLSSGYHQLELSPESSLCHNFQHPCWSKTVQASTSWSQCCIRNVSRGNQRTSDRPTRM